MDAAHIRAAVLFDNLQGSRTHLRTTLVIAQNIQHFLRQLIIIVNHLAGFNLAQQCIGILKVLHARAYENRFGMSSRLQHIVTAGIAEGTADENNVADSINTSQLTDSINNQQRIFLALTAFFQHLGTEAGFIAVMACQLGNFLCSGSFTRCDNQTCMRIFFTDALEGFKQHLFFAGMRRAGNDNRIILFQAQLKAVFRQILRRNLRIGLVKFCITGNKDFAAVGTEMRNIIGINAGLHAKAGYGIEHIIPDTIKVFVIFYGFFGDTAVYHHYRYMTFTDSAQEIRPQLCFYRHEYAGMNTLNQGFCDKRQIQREVDDGICFGNNLLGHVITAYGKGRYQYRTIGHFLADLFYKRTGSNNFAYGCAMNPNAVLAGNLSDILFIYTTEALLKAQGEAFFCKQAVSVIGDNKNYQHY